MEGGKRKHNWSILFFCVACVFVVAPYYLHAGIKHESDHVVVDIILLCLLFGANVEQG